MTSNPGAGTRLIGSLRSADGKGVVLKNVKYFGAQNNDGFEMYRSLDHSANVQGHKFSYSDRNAFLISIDTHEGESGGMGGGK